MRKAPDAFRTISEAADLLETPAHVLRFWESKFPQVKPVKRAGGRRYYRRIDIDLLSGIKLLLHDQGMTIRGVQKLLAEKGPRHVAEMAPFPDDVFDSAVLDDAAEDVAPDMATEEDFVSAEVTAIESPAPADTPTDTPADGPANAFGDVGRVPVTLPRAAPAAAPAPRPVGPVQAAQMAHLLRINQPKFGNDPRLFAVLARIERFTTRIRTQAERDRVR